MTNFQKDKIKILSFDCANRTLGYSIIEVFIKAFEDPYDFIYKKYIKNHNQLLFTLLKCGVYDLCRGQLLKNTNINKRRKHLLEFFNKLIDENSIDFVLLEDQPFGKNKYSWAVQEQISMICSLKNIKCKNIKPKEKLYINFNKEITIENYIKKYGRSRPTNKKFAKDLLRWCLSMKIFGQDMSILRGTPAVFHSDVADSILQVVAFFSYKYKGNVSNKKRNR